MVYRKKFSVDRPRSLSVLFFFCVALLPSRVSAAEDAAEVYFAQALKSKQEGRLLTAERFFRKAIEIEPENADYHFELGNLYIERENLEAARQELEQAIMITPRHLAAHYNLGLVYRKGGWMSDAREQFHRVLDLDPTNVKAQLQIGYTYQAEGFAEEARQAFEIAQEMDLTNPEPKQALEDLEEYEQQISERSRNSMERRFQQNQQFLFQNDPRYGLNPLEGRGLTQQRPQASGREALIQTGALLIQQLLARRSQDESKAKPSS